METRKQMEKVEPRENTDGFGVEFYNVDERVIVVPEETWQSAASEIVVYSSSRNRISGWSISRSEDQRWQNGDVTCA